MWSEWSAQLRRRLWRIVHPEEVPEKLERAFRLTLEGRRGRVGFPNGRAASGNVARMRASERASRLRGECDRSQALDAGQCFTRPFPLRSPDLLCSTMSEQRPPFRGHE